jgi:hypothetical protein
MAPNPQTRSVDQLHASNWRGNFAINQFLTPVTYQFRDGNGAIKYAQTFGGDGSQADPYKLTRSTVISSYAHSSPAITDVGATVLAANSDRKSAYIINRSADDIVELTLGSTALAYGQGLPLYPGQTFLINNSSLYTGVIKARTATGITVNLAVAEGI